MSLRAPKRSNIQYRYAVGIALRNAPRPLLAKEVYDFIKVHMPSICTQKNSNWENAVRSNLTTCDFFEKIEEAPEEGIRMICYYQFRQGGVDEFEEMYPISYGEPYDFLNKPENYKKLYKGEMGYPTDGEIEEARIAFDNRAWRKSIVKLIESQPVRTKRSCVRPQTYKEEEEYQPMRTRGSARREVQKRLQGEEKLRKEFEDAAKDKENKWTPQQPQEELKVDQYQDYFFGTAHETHYGAEQAAQASSGYENQMPQYANFGVYQQNDVGPLRPEVSYSSNQNYNQYQTPYDRPSVQYAQQEYTDIRYL